MLDADSFELGLSTRAIATQMGWSESAVDELLAVHGHRELVALREIDRLYETERLPTQSRRRTARTPLPERD